jgi:DNA mismatch repair protein MutL
MTGPGKTNSEISAQVKRASQPRDSRVRILPAHLANKIAAGEVVQRPSSVLKELLENSLDAGADRIEIVIEEGGKSLIKVADNGSGMSEADLLVALERHATSKIREVEDLEAISTFGFRGEALPSIASVSRMTIKTRVEGEDTATVLNCIGGDRGKITRDSREHGTTVAVANLFFNVPARMKFLKTERTEFRHLYDVIQRIAVSHHLIAFKVIHNGELILDLHPSTFEQRMSGVFGRHDVEGTIPVEESSGPVHVTGFLGKPVVGKTSGGSQYLFLNGRSITSRNINHAVMSAYEHLTLKHAFPFYVLLLELDPRRVDVNVHPSKHEVRFEDEQAIYRLVHNLVRKTLSAAGVVPSLTFSGASPGLRFSGSGSGEGWPANPPVGGANLAAMLYRQPAVTPSGDELGQPPSSSGTVTGREQFVGAGPLWQLHNRYIVVQVDGGVMIVDQHVAHERILYERVVDRMKNHASAAQQLLFPSTVDLNPGEAQILGELMPDLERIGLVVKPFGGGTFIVECVPPELKPGDEDRMLREILRAFQESHELSISDVQDGLAKTFACKAAVKSGDSLNDPEMRFLVENLFLTAIPYVCPHGRPTAVKLSLDELDRRFGRK